MAHRVEPDHVGGTEGAGRSAAQFLAGQVIDHVDRQAEFLRLMHGRQHAEHADPVGDEVRRILGAHHALAQRGGQEAFELVDDLRTGGDGRDQFDQMHVARRVEEMHAAEALLQLRAEAFGQGGDRQARGVRRENRLRRDVRRDLLVQVVLPVHPFGNRLDDQVAAFQQLQIVFVVRDFDVGGVILVAERRRAELFQVVDRAQHDAVLRTFLGRQVEQHHRHPGIDAMGGDLRTHHAGAEYRNFFNNEIRHHLILSITAIFGAQHPIIFHY